MSTYYSPDLSGQDPDYKVTQDTYSIANTGSVIEFRSPIFKDSLIMTLIGTVNEPLVEGVDWITETSDIDYTSMSKLRTIDPNFNSILLKSVTIKRSISSASPILVSMAYQQAYPLPGKLAIQDDALIELTPDLIINMLTRLSLLERINGSVSETHALTQALPKLLPLDPNKENPSNFVTNERHTVNVFDNKALIVPVQGAFFEDSVVVSVPANGITLTKDVDYQIGSLDIAKTKTSTNPSGVYRTILLSYAYAGEVAIAYHAYGGDVVRDDVVSISKSLTNVVNFLNGRDTLTVDVLPTTVPYKTLLNRIVSMEEDVRALKNSGNPTYGDSTNGVTVVKRIRSTDTNFHWWTIAKLYQVEGSTEVAIADRMMLRIRMQEWKLSADVIVSVDLQSPNVMTVDTLSMVQDVGFEKYVSVSVTPVVMPQFRVIYNNDIGNTSGIFLQIGLSLPTLTETIAIEDRSGVESEWILLTTDPTAVNPDDNTLTLPDQTSIWDTANGSSIQVARMIPNKKGYLAWDGTEGVLVNDTWTALTHKLPTSFRIEDIQTVELDVMINGEPRTYVIPMTGPDKDTRVGSAHVSGMIGVESLFGGYIDVRFTRSGSTITFEYKAGGTLSGGGTTIGDLKYVVVKV